MASTSNIRSIVPTVVSMDTKGMSVQIEKTKMGKSKMRGKKAHIDSQGDVISVTR